MKSAAHLHFVFMAEVARDLSAVPSEVLEHSFHASAFGSWWLILRAHGSFLRVRYDGRESVLSVDRDTSGPHVHPRSPSWLQVIEAPALSPTRGEGR
jgi:hypothetical protein